MVRRTRPRRALRYGAPAATLAILTLMVLSRWWILSAALRLTPGHSLSASVGTGRVLLAHNTSSLATPWRSSRISFGRYPVRMTGATPGLDWWFSTPSKRTITSGSLVSTHRSVAIPLWSLALIPATLSALAWRRRRRPRGVCACGYDRTGLPAHSPCPECAAVPR